MLIQGTSLSGHRSIIPYSILHFCHGHLVPKDSLHSLSRLSPLIQKANKGQKESLHLIGISMLKMDWQSVVRCKLRSVKKAFLPRWLFVALAKTIFSSQTWSFPSFFFMASSNWSFGGRPYWFPIQHSAHTTCLKPVCQIPTTSHVAQEMKDKASCMTYKVLPLYTEVLSRRLSLYDYRDHFDVERSRLIHFPSSVLGPRKRTLVIRSTTMLLSLAAIWFLTLRNGLLCHIFI